MQVVPSVKNTRSSFKSRTDKTADLFIWEKGKHSLISINGAGDSPRKQINGKFNSIGSADESK
jgi:hypothetical protein